MPHSQDLAEEAAETLIARLNPYSHDLQIPNSDVCFLNESVECVNSDVWEAKAKHATVLQPSALACT